MIKAGCKGRRVSIETIEIPWKSGHVKAMNVIKAIIFKNKILLIFFSNTLIILTNKILKILIINNYIIPI